jgi:hypothetical protein
MSKLLFNGHWKQPDSGSQQKFLRLPRRSAMLKAHRPLLLCLIVACMFLSLTACRKRVEIMNAGGQITTTQAVSDKEIAAAIIRAGETSKWEIVSVGPGELLGTLNVRRHMAQVTIKYSRSDYRILYKDSLNLKAQEDGTIHPQYNNWIATLNRNIRTQLATLNNPK